jgi:hypothetical protein
VHLGLTGALSLSCHQSIKLYGSTGVYRRTDSNFWTVGWPGNSAGVEGCGEERREVRRA